MPAHLRPSPKAIKLIEAVRKRTGQTHDHFFVHVLGHREMTRKVMRQDFERARVRWSDLSERELLRAVLVSRLMAQSAPGTPPLFGVSPALDETEVEQALEDILTRHSTLDTLTDAIIEDEARSAIPVLPGFEEDADAVSEALAADNAES